jgi:DNA-binding NtrC family response regulator
MEKISVLIVDDDVEMLEMLSKVLTKKNYAVEAIPEPLKAIQRIEESTFDIIVTDIQMPRMSGLEILRKVRDTSPDSRVIMITAFGSVDSAVEAMKLGAYDYISKPFNIDELLIVLEKAANHKKLQREVELLRGEVERKYSFSSILGKSKAIQDLFGLIKIIANTRSNVLIFGKSGTGKELVAKAIHYNSIRKNEPFVAINCSAIPENLLESELFGHEKGAYTGAVSSQRGLFEAAHGGTLLLDEIGEMPATLQAKLLRVLEDWEIRPVGSDRTKQVDVRLITATHRDLKQAVVKGTFREDLFYRLNVIYINLPDLRDRPEDIPLLTNHFLQQYADEVGKKGLVIHPDAMARLVNYAWPGNVRELENVIEQAVVLTSDSEVRVEDLPESVRSISEHEELGRDLTSGYMTLQELEKRYIGKVLEYTNYHQTKSSEILGIDRRTLYRKIREYRLKNLIR